MGGRVSMDDRLKTAVLLASDKDNDTKQSMIMVAKNELADLKLQYWIFDLRLSMSERTNAHIYRFYVPNMKLYRHHTEGKMDPAKLVDMINRLRDKFPDIYKQLESRFPAIEKASTVDIVVALKDYAIGTAIRATTAEFVRDSLGYAPISGREWSAVIEHVSTITNRISFVLSTASYTDVANAFETFPLVFFLVDYVNGARRLMALSRVTYENWPKIVRVDRIGSLVKGACKKISTDLAKLFISQGTSTVNIESINNSANMCYLKSYLPLYRYGIMTATTASQFSALVDESTIDIWIARYNNSSTLNVVTIYGTVHMQYIKDAATLLSLKKGKFAEYSHGGLEVYCRVNDDIAAFIDNFIEIAKDNGYDSSRRVFIIARPEEFRAKFPHKRQKLSLEGEEEDE